MKTRRRLMQVAILGVALCASPILAAQTPPLYTKWVNYTPANGFPEGEVFCVTVDGNRVWAGTSVGLVLIEDGRVKKVFTPADGLAGRPVMSIAVDKTTGDVWIGTFGGLSRYSGGQFTNFTNLSSGLANDLVYGVAVQGKDVWIATAAGLNTYNTWDHSWAIYNETNAPFDEPWAYAVTVTKEKVYAGVWGGGVIVYDIARHMWRPYEDPDGSMEIVLYKNQGLLHQIVSSIAYNPDTDMFWAGTYFGLSGYDGHNWHNYLSKDSGLVSDFINGVKSRGNEVWACTQLGLSELDYKTNTWVTYRPANWQALDAGKRGDPDPGEIIITRPDGKQTKIETPTSIAHNYILNMDFQGKDIWVATARGLSHGMIQPLKEGQLDASVRNRR